MADFEKAKRKRALKIQHLEEQIKNLNKFCTSKKSIQFLDQKTIQIKDLWESITKTTNEMMNYDNYTKDEHQELTRIQDTYDDAIIQIEEKRAASTTNRSIKLPPLNIPPFNGNHLEWKSFHDLFEQTIAKDHDISNSEKLQFLKTLVMDEASQMISHLQTTEENFDTAWTLLQKRYNNERRLVETYVKELLKQPCIKEESAESLKQLHDNTMEYLRAIQNLGVNTEPADFLLNTIILQKLDPETIRMYETTRTNPREMQKFEDLLNIIEKRFQSLESIEENREDKSFKH